MHGVGGHGGEIERVAHVYESRDSGLAQGKPYLFPRAAAEAGQGETGFAVEVVRHTHRLKASIGQRSQSPAGEFSAGQQRGEHDEGPEFVEGGRNQSACFG